MDLALPGVALAHELYVSARAQGYGQKGTHALALSLARLSAIEL
jgi:3-hydroxyisobutyrate dehydrogenase